MGILDSIGGGIVGAIGSLGSSYLNWRSQQETNATNVDLANTAVQRRARDMEAAGLNPVLAAGNPASSPALTAPRVEDPSAAALGGAQRAQAIAVSGEQERLVRILADKAEADRQGVALDNALKSATLGARTSQVNAESQYAVRTLDNRVTQVFDDTQVKNTASYVAQLTAEWNEQRVKGQTSPDNLVQLQAEYLAARTAAMNQGIEASRANVAAMAFAIQKSGMDADALKAIGIPPYLLELVGKVVQLGTSAATAGLMLGF